MRRRLVLAIALVATAAVVLFAVPLGLVLRNSYRSRELLRLQRDTIAATRQIDLSHPGVDPAELPATQGPLAGYDLHGRRLVGRGPGVADGVVRDALRSGTPADEIAGGRLRVAVPLVSGERVTGVVRAERSDAAVAASTHRAWLELAALAAGLVAAAVLAAIVLGRRLSGPLERLASAATRLGDGDFSVRAPRAGIPEVDRVAAALDTTAARLDELVTRERAFSSDASHQLRTPLAAMRIELEALALRDGPSPAELTAALEQAQRLQTTVETLLAVARDVPRRDARTDLGPALDALEQRWRGPLAADSRPLRLILPAGTAEAAASAPVVDEILDVLVGNAARHGAGEVAVRVRATDGSVAVDVSDEGLGFAGDPEDAFARRTGAGHGIGLALARSLAQAEGGRLTVTRPGPNPRLTLLLRAAAGVTPPRARDGAARP